MSHEANVHPAQTAILRELLFVPTSRFKNLQNITGLESDHLKFHTARLIELKYIQKNENGDYALTSLGKEYSNKMDTDQNKIERQPKSAVILVIENEKGELLVQERLKHPFYGFWGFAGGKIRWGETILEAAARELMEETNMEAALIYRGVYHELTRSKETGEILEDKIMHIIYGSHPTDTMKDSFDGGRNNWLTPPAILAKKKAYKSMAIEMDMGMGKQSFVETEQTYDSEEF